MLANARVVYRVKLGPIVEMTLMRYSHSLKHRQPGRTIGPRHKVPRHYDNRALELQDTVRYEV